LLRAIVSPATADRVHNADTFQLSAVIDSHIDVDFIDRITFPAPWPLANYRALEASTLECFGQRAARNSA
jgi:hypothetical protein